MSEVIDTMDLCPLSPEAQRQCPSIIRIRRFKYPFCRFTFGCMVHPERYGEPEIRNEPEEKEE